MNRSARLPRRDGQPAPSDCCGFEATVNHPLRKSQMTRTYFKKRLRGIGRASSRLRRLRGERPRQVCGLTLYMVRQLAEATGRWLSACVSVAKPAQRFYARGDVDIALGYLHEDFVAWRGTVASKPQQSLGAG